MWRFEINVVIFLALLSLFSGCSKDTNLEERETVTPDIQKLDQSQTKTVTDNKRKLDAEIKKEMTNQKMVAAPLMSVPGKLPRIPSPPDTSQYGDFFKEEGSSPELVKVADKLTPYYDRSLLKKLPKEEMKKLIELQKSITLKYYNEVINRKKKSLSHQEIVAMRKEIETVQNKAIFKQFPEYKAIIKQFKLLQEQRVKRTQELNKISNQRLVLLKKREQYSINGVITDEAGELLPDVEMVVHISYNQEISFVKGISDKKFTVNIPDGKINYRIKPQYGKVKLVFKKKGYYPPLGSVFDISRPVIGTEMDQRIRDRILAAKNKIPPILFRKRHQIKVVLDKKGSRAKLTSYNGRLTYKTDGSGTVMDFSKPKSKTHKIMREVKNVKEEKMLPKYCIVFSAIPNKAGIFEDLISSAIFKGVPKKNYNNPVIEYRLIINDPDPTAGFWMIDPLKEGKYHNDDRMSEAPQTGYVRELIFGSDQEYQIGYFYTKINGKYGKGYIGKSGIYGGYYHESNEAKCLISIDINEDGTRQLRTGGRYSLSPRLIYKKP